MTGLRSEKVGERQLVAYTIAQTGSQALQANACQVMFPLFLLPTARNWYGGRYTGREYAYLVDTCKQVLCIADLDWYAPPVLVLPAFIRVPILRVGIRKTLKKRGFPVLQDFVYAPGATADRR